MQDSIIDKIEEKIKDWFKKNSKFLIVILLYLLYQSNFIIAFISSLGINVNSIPRTPRIFLFAFTDLIYIVILILMFKKEIVKGLKDLKENFLNRAILSLNCWVVGCVIMTVSSIIIGLILDQNISENESLVRQSIEIAPLYMLFTCSIIAPIFEEMVFRRSLYGFVKVKWLFIVLSGVLFGLLHVLGSYNSILDFLYVIPYGAMGSCFAYLLTKTKNITLPIIVHMLHNTILVLVQIIRR